MIVELRVIYDSLTNFRFTGYSMFFDKLFCRSGYEVAYDYDDVGRLDNVSWTVEDKTGSVSYTRLSNADLLEQMSFSDGLTTAYAYEDHRDLKTQVTNAYNAGPSRPTRICTTTSAAGQP